MEQYILSVPYDSEQLDFAKLLSGLRDVKVSRTGPRRRVQVILDESRFTEVCDRLPKMVRVEPVIHHAHVAT